MIWGRCGRCGVSWHLGRNMLFSNN